MKLARDILGLLAIFLLGLGYLGSQWAYDPADPLRATQWAFAMDQPPIRILASILLLGAIVCAFVPVKEDE